MSHITTVTTEFRHAEALEAAMQTVLNTEHLDYALTADGSAIEPTGMDTHRRAWALTARRETDGTYSLHGDADNIQYRTPALKRAYGEQYVRRYAAARGLRVQEERNTETGRTRLRLVAAAART